MRCLSLEIPVAESASRLTRHAKRERERERERERKRERERENEREKEREKEQGYPELIHTGFCVTDYETEKA